jgi:glycosyltransferase involved in cell wall biosynthesis
VEGFLRAQLLDRDNPLERELLREVVSAEYQLGHRADLVLACSSDDKQMFSRIYEWSFGKMRVLPNGVMTDAIVPFGTEQRMSAKQDLGLVPGRLAAIFIGSQYGPNVEAAQFIVDELAQAVPGLYFVIAGGVGAALCGPMPPNVIRTGALDESAKIRWLHASDIGINPMFSGSGTNIKMFDLMAAGLPVVTTAVGARGISAAGRPPFIVAEASAQGFAAALRGLMIDPEARAARAQEARSCVVDGYSWERISPHLGKLLRERLSRGTVPFFSVVIPSFDRHRQLEELMDCLDAQSERSFEVIVVDQSAQRWPGEATVRRFPLTYVYTDVRGAVRARNIGADYARGTVIAFTDDDCRPTVQWLSAARKRFEAESIVGLEGLIESDHLDDPAYRPVTNVGCEGIGFMTANLFVRNDTFHRLDGFDLAFDRPHFREDTDFGWRLLAIGAVPFSRRAKVFHPAQPRSIEREAAATRARFFEKDALLLSKHPARYRLLFEVERHWEHTQGFWENFKRGAELYGVDVEEYLSFEQRGRREA